MADPKAQLKVIRVIHFGLMGGPTLFAIVASSLALIDDLNNEQIEVLNYLSPALFFIALAAQSFLFKSIVKPALDEEAFEKKMPTFQTAHIARMAVLEAAALLAAIALLINQELLHLITVGLVLAIMFTKIPTAYLLENELRLTPEEKEKLVYCRCFFGTKP